MAFYRYLLIIWEGIERRGRGWGGAVLAARAREIDVQARLRGVNDRLAVSPKTRGTGEQTR